tara:strand:+ start:34 stop:285 length:252 start_codon:yes stop_codon:yes gene_type:complete
VISIIVQDPLTWDNIKVPPAIVRYCADWTKEDPYKKNTADVELELLDCYWHKMGYYNDEGLINISPIEVMPYDMQGTRGGNGS